MYRGCLVFFFFLEKKDPDILGSSVPLVINISLTSGGICSKINEDRMTDGSWSAKAPQILSALRISGSNASLGLRVITILSTRELKDFSATMSLLPLLSQGLDIHHLKIIKWFESLLCIGIAPREGREEREKLARLDEKKMIQNHNLAKSISDVAWGMLVTATQSKAACSGSEVVLVDPGIRLRGAQGVES